MVVAGVVALAAAGGVAAFAIGVALAGLSDSALGRIGDAGSTTVGSCLHRPTDDSSVATVVGCGQRHDGESYEAGDLGSGLWPGYGTEEDRADDVCFDAFEGYVGTSYDSSRYDYGYFLPDQAEWLAGEHRVVCVVLPGDEDALVGSVRRSAR